MINIINKLLNEAKEIANNLRKWIMLKKKIIIPWEYKSSFRQSYTRRF